METDGDGDYVPSRNIFLAAMLCQTMGVNTITGLPKRALVYGAAGHILVYSAIYIFIGIPLFYMEQVTSQFTSRDCIEVWKARRCLSHIAYVQLLWQTINVITSILYSSFVLHYFLISFEKPIPYYVCGSWSTRDCNILYKNYTIHQDCLSINNRSPYCVQLCKTFPEYQYWRYNILAWDKKSFHLSWRIILACGIMCLILLFCCFRAIKGSKWLLGGLIIHLISGRFLFLVGSMLQKGIVMKFQDALDYDFSAFMEYFSFSACCLDVLNSLNIGSGISYNLASKSSFRSPCYSNTVVVVVISAAIAVLGTCSNAIMLCPYSFIYGVHPFDIAHYPIYSVFELVPRLLSVYESKSVWLIIFYSFIITSFLCLNIITISCFVEILIKRYKTVNQYPGLLTVGVVMCLFIISIPLLGNIPLSFMIVFHDQMKVLLIFTALIECLVFLLCYGLERFCEDVHFMLGVKPKLFVKLSWVVSIIALIYVFWVEMYIIYNIRHSSEALMSSWWILVTIILLTVLGVLVKLCIAFYKKRFSEEISLDPSWGPTSDVLKRSRAMFTTHAMTKEYIYRQYHLQAGILMRQKRCNIRN